MKYFNEAWYRSGCPRIKEYADYFLSIQKMLPSVFQQNASFHDAQVQAVQIIEVMYGKQNIIIDLDPTQSMTAFRHLIFKDADVQLDHSAIGGWCVTYQVYATANGYELNMLVVDSNNDLSEIKVKFQDACGG